MRGFIITILGLTCAAAMGQTPADLVLRNGKIVTVDEKIGEVEALAVRGGSLNELTQRAIQSLRLTDDKQAS